MSRHRTNWKTRAAARTALVPLVVMMAACVGDASPTGRAPIAGLAVADVAAELAWPRSASFDVELRPLRPLPFEAGTPVLFVHLENASGDLVRTFDRAVPGVWTEGQPLRFEVDLYQSALAEPLAAGEYALTAGLYDLALGRYELETSHAKAGRREWKLGSVRVSPPGGGPSVQLGAGWGPVAKSSDLQILARRRLLAGERGELRIEGAAKGDTLRTVWRLAVPSEAGHAVELLEGAEAARIRLDGDCLEAPVEAELADDQSATLDATLRGGTGCELAASSTVVVPPGETTSGGGPWLEIAALGPAGR